MKKSQGLLVFLCMMGAGCGSDSRTPLVVYSPHGRELLQAFEQRFEAVNPNVDVQWLDLGSQAVLDRIRSEKANPQADVWWGAPTTIFENAAREGLLDGFAPAWVSALPPDARDDQQMWHGTYLTPEVIAYNRDAVDSARVPRDWDDVLKPEWRDQILIRDPLESGTMRVIFGMILSRSIRETGDTAAGFNWLRRLDAQTKEYVLNGPLMLQKLARREGLITLWDMPDVDEAIEKSGLPIAYVFPTSGTPLPVEGIAVVKNSPQPELARRFVEFVGSDSEILHAARFFYRLPARTDLPADSLPENLRRAREQIVVEPIDWQMIQERTPEWMRHWDEHVRGRG